MKRIHLFLIPLFLLVLLSGCMVQKDSKDESMSTLQVPREASSSSAIMKQEVRTLQELIAMSQSGDGEAQFNLGMVHLEGTGSLKNTKEGLLWLEKSAEQGYVKAQFNMGVIYYQGSDGVKKDYTKARAWFQKAAAGGDRLAQFNLGVMEYRGEGMKPDYKKAKDSFLRASALGHAEGAYNIGVMYAKGEGVTRDTIEAIAWFSISEAQGAPKATEVKKGLLARLSDDEKKKASERSVALAKELVALAVSLAPTNSSASASSQR